ncbi:DUF2294 domain-containing protein [Synechococcus sp. PCC 7336]|uniref:DUF2294 domain-containing protein n=1 Tax=Synechococcus sp. PCC 7336 TaxID=195250 RepID=UPI000346C370|nr:DUF2294 domain-containing protein [Synechococcus sp. PCC 7336]
MSDTNEDLPTSGQLERTLSQRMSSLFAERLGHRPSQVTCQLSQQQVAIVVEGSITPAEQLLSTESDSELAEDVRDSLDEALRPDIKQIVEDSLQVGVQDMMSDATLETGRTGIIVMLEEVPQTRPARSTQK